MELKKAKNEVLETFINALRNYSMNIPHIESIIIVGFYARGTNKEDSDLDIVIITSYKSEVVINQNFV